MSLVELRALLADEILRMPEYLRDGYSFGYAEQIISKLDQLTETVNVATSTEYTEYPPETYIELLALASEFREGLLIWQDFDGDPNEIVEKRRQVAVSLWDRYLAIRIAHVAQTEPKFEVPVETDVPAIASSGRRFKLQQIAKSCSVPGLSGVFILGTFDLKKTIHTQQRRAFAVVNALHEVGAIKSGTKVAVVGGGIAGVTAALAAAHYGANVDLYEENSELLHYQIGNDQRVIHPNLFDWPAPGSQAEETNLPYLNWSEGTAKEIASNVLKELKKAKSLVHGTIQEHTGQEGTIKSIITVHNDNDGTKIEVSGDDPSICGQFDVCVIAVGFGAETENRRKFNTPLYWDEDNLHQKIGYSTDNPETILVSGTGDGALLDTIRATIDDFQQSKLVTLFDFFEDGDFCEELVKIEHEAEDYFIKFNTANFGFFEKYRNLLLSKTSVEVLTETLTSNISEARKVTLNYRSTGVFSLGSSPLNRLIVTILAVCKFIEFKRQLLTPEMIVRDESGRLGVLWTDRQGPIMYDRLIVRHGPDQNHFGERFPEIWKSIQYKWKAVRDLEVSTNLDDELIFPTDKEHSE